MFRVDCSVVVGQEQRLSLVCRCASPFPAGMVEVAVEETSPGGLSVVAGISACRAEHLVLVVVYLDVDPCSVESLSVAWW